jgi:hypothetical protein
MPRVGFKPTIPVFERTRTVHALDRAATVIGYCSLFFTFLNYCIYPYICGVFNDAVIVQQRVVTVISDWEGSGRAVTWSTVPALT